MNMKGQKQSLDRSGLRLELKDNKAQGQQRTARNSTGLRKPARKTMMP